MQPRNSRLAARANRIGRLQKGNAAAASPDASFSVRGIRSASFLSFCHPMTVLRVIPRSGLRLEPRGIDPRSELCKTGRHVSRIHRATEEPSENANKGVETVRAAVG